MDLPRGRADPRSPFALRSVRPAPSSKPLYCPRQHRKTINDISAGGIRVSPESADGAPQMAPDVPAHPTQHVRVAPRPVLDVVGTLPATVGPAQGQQSLGPPPGSVHDHDIGIIDDVKPSFEQTEAEIIVL